MFLLFSVFIRLLLHSIVTHEGGAIFTLEPEVKEPPAK